MHVLLRLGLCYELLERFFEDHVCIDMPPIFLSYVRSDQVLCLEGWFY